MNEISFRFVLNIAAKVENLMEGGSYLVYATLERSDGNGDPMGPFAIRLDKATWDQIDVGDIVVFAPVCQGPPRNHDYTEG